MRSGFLLYGVLPLIWCIMLWFYSTIWATFEWSSLLSFVTFIQKLWSVLEKNPHFSETQAFNQNFSLWKQISFSNFKSKASHSPILKTKQLLQMFKRMWSQSSIFFQSYVYNPNVWVMGCVLINWIQWNWNWNWNASDQTSFDVYIFSNTPPKVDWVWQAPCMWKTSNFQVN